ncbi:MAG TPA: hypothetical protein VE912_04455 [Bacteroidales bacterium]|nr:hypothetical protein [Bacteroidales bacterium]
MSKLTVTLIDVGWGDSILLESIDSNNTSHFGLIDSNDTTYERSSFIYLKKYFDRKSLLYSGNNHIFDFIMLSHAHSDHGQGLKGVLKEFGTKNFWYPKSLSWSSMVYLINYANRYQKFVDVHQSVDDTKILPNFGKVIMKVLWPRYGDSIDTKNENNNSIVLTLQLDEVVFILTVDAEAEVWQQISSLIPPNTKLFKVPHHGSVNGTFDNNNTPWLDQCPSDTVFPISSHIKPFKHPHQKVIDELDSRNKKYFRTDQQYHLTFETDGTSINTKYSHY